jgi:hypothetical protein
MAEYPQIFRLRQRFPRERVDDIPGHVARALAGLELEGRLRPGQRVAITAGSRGIANIPQILRAAADYFRSRGCEPFLVPAMGSHGGGTAEGQRGVLESYGITETTCGCPIRASMETVIVCQAEAGFPVHFDRLAFEADHVLVCGRIKPHTLYEGPIESGLLKMMLIGLGKHEGAKTYHLAFQDHSFDSVVRQVSREVLARCPIVGGLAILENAYDETARIVAVEPALMEERETELLRLARQWMPRLPFSHIDVLLIDEIGKDISGAGMDTNVVGRKRHENHAAADEFPKIKRIIARGLTPTSHGNAIGIGIADLCLTRLTQQINRPATWINAITSGHFGAAKIPPDFATDREAIDVALATVGLFPREQARLVWIRNTLDLGEVECSEAYLDEVQRRDDLEPVTSLRALPFDAAGRLPASMGELT